MASSDAAGLLPLQEALGYDMAQSLFSQRRNLVLEGPTDWDVVSDMLRDSGGAALGEKGRAGAGRQRRKGRVLRDDLTILHLGGLAMDSCKRPDSDVANFDHQLFDLARWEFREFAAFLQFADSTFVARRAGSDEAINEPASSQIGPVTSVHAVDGLCPTGPFTPATPDTPPVYE